MLLLSLHHAHSLHLQGSGFETADLETILSAQQLPDGLVIPKVESAAQLQWVDQQLERILGAERARPLILIALIESVEAMINIREIALSSPRLRAFIFGADDYRASVGAMSVQHWPACKQCNCSNKGIRPQRFHSVHSHCCSSFFSNAPASVSACFFALYSKSESNDEVSFARNLVLLHAKAAGLDAIDLVQTNFSDPAVVAAEAAQGFRLGFTGKQIIHPKQVEPVQRAFAPDAKSVEWAQRVVAEAIKQEAAGVGAFTIDGQMVDAPLIKKAQQIVGKAQQCGILPKPQ